MHILALEVEFFSGLERFAALRAAIINSLIDKWPPADKRGGGAHLSTNPIHLPQIDALRPSYPP